MRDSPSYRDLFHSAAIAWQCRAGHSSLGLTPLCPIRLVACMDDSPVHDLAEQQEETRFFSLEKKIGRRIQEGDHALNQILCCYGDEIARALREEPARRRVLATSIASESAVAFAAKTGCELISNPPELSDWLHDKRNFLAGLQQLGLPRLPGRWTRLSDKLYGELAAELGASFVAQLARGSSGSGTAFIQSASDYASAAARFGDAWAWIAPDLGRLSLNINALALANGVAVSYPSVQLEGLAMLSADRGMYCGNDYLATSALPSQAVGDVVEQTARIGRWIASLGFRGLFGLDFVISESGSKAYAVDLNPRWQGSTAPLTQAESKAGRLPLALADLAYRMKLMSETEVLRRQDEFLQPVRASHLSLRCPSAGFYQVTGGLRPGVYKLAREPLFVRPGLRLSDLEQPQEFLVAGGLPRPGAWMGPQSHIVRISSEQQVMDVSGLRPLAWSQAAAAMFYAALALAPASTEP